ncbi:DNA repair and recombination protein mus-11 [Cytospora mali]|uniref:RAD52 homolog n=1 Tax=Cytospora mali TaxID=578113 RepID=A0A194WCW9_CYTMA|nr:DNA repair and recombination protein mus-11 [Valsa mali]
MPAPGDQHGAIVNPFEEAKPRVSEYTAQEIATLQSRLEKQLGPEYLSARTGPSGQKVHYIAAEKCIALANEVFGFNGWSSAIKEVQVDFVDENAQTLKISLGLSVIVRVTLRDGTFHEDIGYGHIENCKGKAAAFEKAKKEGTTDALKRALRNFGNVLGNCIYDKEYLKKVTKMKAEPHRGWDEGGLHRHADYQKKEEVKREQPSASAIGAAAASVVESFEDLLGEFDEVDFNIVDDGHPDEVVLHESARPQAPQTNNNNNRPNPQPMQPPSRPLARSQSAGNPIRPPPQTPGQQFPRPGHQNHPNQFAARPPQQQPNQPRPQNGPTGQQSNASSSSSGPHQTPPQATGENAAAMETVGFFSARAVKQLTGSKEDEEPKLPTVPTSGLVFNPHAESPSIRKTAGIDHTKSKPVGRDIKHVAPAERGTETPTKSTGPSTSVSAGAGRGAPAVGGFASAGGGQQGSGFGPGPSPAQRGNVVNPQLNQARRIGAPMGPGSPMAANRGQYRPPTIKRPLPSESNANGGARPALADVTTNGTANAAAGAGAGGDPKRQKIG